MADIEPDRADRLAAHIRSTPGTWMASDPLGIGPAHSVLEWYREQGIDGHLWNARTDLATIAERYPDLLTRREGHRHTYDTPEGASP